MNWSLFFSCISAFLITWWSIPSIIKVAQLKQLHDEPDDRKEHRACIPTLGGLAIFAGVIIATTLWTAKLDFPERPYLLSSVIILFFLGIKDDILVLAPEKKLMGQLLAACLMVFFADVRINSMYGIFGVQEIPYQASVALSVFVFILIVNAYNMIDGIDGLAGGVGLIASVSFGLLFFFTGHIPQAILAFSLAAALLAFLRFNFAPAKIFMGDTGSMFCGFILGYLAMRFIAIGPAGMPVLGIGSGAPVLVMAILILPLIDTLRVFVIRLIKRKSPFSADKNHIHHALTLLGFSHTKTCFILYGVNLVAIVAVWQLSRYSVNTMLITYCGIMSVIWVLPRFFTKPDGATIIPLEPQTPGMTIVNGNYLEERRRVLLEKQKVEKVS